MANEPIQAFKSCFVAMPISDPPGYDTGHFRRVYEHIVRPACAQSDIVPVRADDVKAANYIVLDILQRIIEADLVICDLSARNANVMYELGVRQAFNLPVVLIKDQRTERVFDIQGFRTLEYDESLRIDCVNRNIESLRVAIGATIKPDHKDVNSLVKLLGIPRAELLKNSEVSADTALILSSVRDISERLSRIEQSRFNEERLAIFSGGNQSNVCQPQTITLPSGEETRHGEEIYDKPGGTTLGTILAVEPNGVIIRKTDGTIFAVPPDDDLYNTVSVMPF